MGGQGDEEPHHGGPRPVQASRDPTRGLANAIYFKAEWRNTFDEDDTIHEEFHLLDGRTVEEVPFMRRHWRFYQQIACHDGFRVLSLPYKSFDDSSPGYSYKLRKNLPEFSMCVFLPDERDGLWGLVDRLTSRPEFLRENLPTKWVLLDPLGSSRVDQTSSTEGGEIMEVPSPLAARTRSAEHGGDGRRWQ